MSLLTHQSFANTDTPYWASASVPTSLVSPLSVIDTYGVPTKKTSIITESVGRGTIVVSGIDNSNPVGITLTQGATQPLNNINFNVGNVNAAMTMTTSNVISSLPMVLDSPLNTQNFSIVPTPGGVELQMGAAGSGGGVIAMTNSPTGVVGVMGATTMTQSSIVFADKFNNDTTITEKQIQFGNAVGNVAQVGLSGSSAYLGTSTAPLTTPGVLVNINNGAELQFTDASANVFGMKTNAGVLTISAPLSTNAITIASTGQVTIPDIISGSFVPLGGIVMYSGLVGSLPTNWKICDGTGGTPDLRDRFIIGAGTFASGATGGSATISILNLPSHNHGINDPGHIHSITDPGHFHTTTAMSEGNQGINGAAGGRLGNNQGNNSDTKTTGITINSQTTGITTQNTGSATAYYPPYYALAYIIRVA
jgi:hypothetical protein